MRCLVLFLIALCLAWGQGGAGPHDLRCENAANPQGVKAPHPQLSWVLNPNVVQNAYHVLVATSEEKLKADEADLWDSGQVRSDQKTVQYRGKPLTSLQRCYWKVRIWTSYYSPYNFSEPASWKMGVLHFDDPATAP